MVRAERPGERARAWVARGFTGVEDVVYVLLGLLLAVSALALLASAGVALVRMLVDGSLAARVITVLDQLLLVLMIVEVLYTVQVSFREHALVPEPFLVVGLIASIRRVLVVTAQFSEPAGQHPDAMRTAMLELGLLTLMILALVGALALVRRRAPGVAAEKA
ncbi:MAG TPA: phosphate-starvation-inducible PsiE family protein [Methylomirabilota bacterium]|nr:phosphate-starvation-inducible PsiE family protein [Methylomirabilota bacterium]